MADEEKLSFNPWSMRENGVVISYVRVTEAAVIAVAAGFSEMWCLFGPALVGLLFSIVRQRATLPDYSPKDKPGKYSLYK